LLFFTHILISRFGQFLGGELPTYPASPRLPPFFAPFTESEMLAFLPLLASFPPPCLESRRQGRELPYRKGGTYCTSASNPCRRAWDSLWSTSLQCFTLRASGWQVFVPKRPSDTPYKCTVPCTLLAFFGLAALNGAAPPKAKMKLRSHLVKWSTQNS